MTTRLRVLVCVLLFFAGQQAEGDPVGGASVPNERELSAKSEGMMKWRYSKAGHEAKTKAESKAYSKGSMNNSKAEGSMNMKMMRMMMWYKYPSNPKTQPPVPTRAPDLTTPMPTIEVDPGAYRRCIIVMAVSDLDRDDVMTAAEYVRFVNRLGQDAFAGEEFEELEMSLQENYYFLVGEEDGLDVMGSKPGDEVEDDAHLRRICAFTLTVVAQLEVTPPSGPPNEEDDSDVWLPMCFLSMVISDANRDGVLDQAEYVFFINRYTYTEDDYEAETFDALDTALQENFFELATDGTLNIAGARPGETPTDELVASCTATHEIIESLVEESSL